MKNLSAVIIAKNGQDLLPDCIHSLQFCDEILVVDGGSTDSTMHVAKKLGARVISGAIDDFAKQRTIGLHEVQGKWILYVDTDEQVSKPLQDSILSTITNETSAQTYTVKRKNYYLGNHLWPKIETMERLFRKTSLRGWEGQLHESPIITGTVGALEGFLLHFSHRDLSSMLKKTNQWSAIEAKLRFDHHHPHMSWWRFFRVMLTGFYDSYITQQGLKAGTVGVIESIYQSFSLFITYAKLWELQQGENLDRKS